MNVRIAIALVGMLAFHCGITGSLAREPSAEAARGSVPDSAAASSATAALGASALVGLTIEDQFGGEVGEVRDLLVHLPSGRIRSLVVSLGNLLGHDLWMLPTRSLQYSEDRQRMVLALSRDELLQQERFSPSDWPDLDNTAYWTTPYPAGPELRRVQAKQVYLATDIIGETVENPRGENLGTIRDLVIDLATGQALQLVLEFDPGVFTTERLVAVPIAAFTPPPAAPHTVETLDSLLLAMSPSELRALPVVQRATAAGANGI